MSTRGQLRAAQRDLAWTRLEASCKALKQEIERDYMRRRNKGEHIPTASAPARASKQGGGPSQAGQTHAANTISASLEQSMLAISDHLAMTTQAAVRQAQATEQIVSSPA
jgi:hypothetical protein